ncbi:putative fibroin heavy chain [Triplophysa rosa]|uniref:Fibroin heavy chain n=2 Tax=Triplophysa rosa TaxID=992332 RepID=A0A9W7WG71_TRIRA|nr:putative fibroin heavy chain [Triplophysa rosa]
MMSKLKRKKPAVENCRPEQQSVVKNTSESFRRVQESHCSKTLTDSSPGGAVPWWERSELNDVERIWALTLTALCPTLQTHQEECIPQLPPPSSTLLQGAPVEKVSDWKWGSPNKDFDLPDLPAPSYALHPPPVNDPTSRPPTVEDTGESTARTDQGEGASVCDLQPTQHQHLEGHASLDKQSDRLGPARKVSQRGEITDDHGNAAVKMCSSLKRPLSYEEGERIKLNTNSPSVHRYGQNSSVPTGRQGREGEKRGGLGNQVVASGSGAGGSKLRVGTKQGAGGSGTQLKTKPGAGGATSGLGIKSRAGGSESELGTESGAGGSGSGLRTKTGAGGSGSGLGTKSGESMLSLEIKPESKSELECCPMCLMAFPAGFSQMECDGHLAQCLSEMHEDIVW